MDKVLFLPSTLVLKWRLSSIGKWYAQQSISSRTSLVSQILAVTECFEVVRAATNHPSLQKLTLNLQLSISLIEVGQLAAMLGTLKLKEF
jgi:hypothetical protein